MHAGPLNTRRANSKTPRVLALLTTLGLVVALPAGALSIEERIQQYERLQAKAQVAQQLRPQRRETPLREENIHDGEVQQIESQVRALLPEAIVNIGPVVSGCPCEDGANCTDQIWVVAETPPSSLGLLLSRIGGYWTVGPVQAWWLELLSIEQAYQKGGDGNRALELRKRRDEHLLAFPECAAP